MATKNRPEVLDGATYKLPYANALEEQESAGRKLRCYVTINDDGQEPFEVFVRYDNARIIEWTTITTLLITRCLREAADPKRTLLEIAEEMIGVHSPYSQHITPGTSTMVPSLVAAIGEQLKQHLESGK